MPIQFNQNPGKPGLVIYLTVGDPDVATTRNVALAAIDAGAEVLELGVPFSDPLADGPVIQRASERALTVGTTLGHVLALAAELRSLRPAAGLVIFSYYNPILRFGLERFCAEASKAGVDGVLITDVIVEEADEYLAQMQLNKLQPIFLAAPTSSDYRLELIAGVSQGFVYAISRVGITGAQTSLASDAQSLVQRLRRYHRAAHCRRLWHLYGGACSRCGPVRRCSRNRQRHCRPDRKERTRQGSRSDLCLCRGFAPARAASSALSRTTALSSLKDSLSSVSVGYGACGTYHLQEAVEQGSAWISLSGVRK